MSITDFDTSKYVLGSLCKRSHDYQGTGRSLRYKGGACVSCCAMLGKKKEARLKAIAEEKFREFGVYFLGNPCKYGHTDPESGLTQRYSKNDHCVECFRLRRQTEQARARGREYQRLKRLAEPEKIRERDRQRHYKNRDARLAMQRRIRDANCEKYREMARQSYYRRRDKVKEKAKEYRASERGKKILNEAFARRRARIAECVTIKVTPEQWGDRISQFNNCCAYCGAHDEKLTQDHFLPIHKGGSHNLGNLIPACFTCNSSKNTRFADEWYPRQPFYSAARWRKILKVLGIKETQTTQITLL